MALRPQRRKKTSASQSGSQGRSKSFPLSSDETSASERYAVTTIRLTPDQYEWLRRTALDRALAKGGKADASAVVRELVDAARKKKPHDRTSV
jgi:hypothetical protein